MAEVSFEPSEQWTTVAEAYYLDAIDVARKNFELRLDGSEDSIRVVEELLGQLHDDLATSEPDEETVWRFARIFGSYIGEVVRKHHGGEWGDITMDDMTFPGLQQGNGGLIWPWSRAHKRIVDGPMEDVWAYYRSVTS